MRAEADDRISPPEFGVPGANGDVADGPGTIQIRVEDVSQLFNMLDPFPFRERDLDREAEDYIVGWARELPADRPIRILVHLPDEEVRTPGADNIGDAFAHFFAYRADALKLDLRELFRLGRRSLAIGLAVLGICLLLSHMVMGRVGEGPAGRFVEESLIIVGWVANWRPIEIFLYDWWPLARRRRLYLRLAEAEVAVRPEMAGSLPWGGAVPDAPRSAGPAGRV